MTQSKDTATALARKKASAIIADQKKRDKRKRILITVSVSVVALIFLGLVTFFSISSAKTKKQEASVTGVQIEPQRVANGAFYVAKDGKSPSPGPDSKATRVDLFFDPQCPGCGVVDRGIGDRLEELVQNEEIDLYLRPVSFLDKASADRYSTRSVNAVVTVAEKAPEKLLPFVNAIYAKSFQPAEGGASVSDSKLASEAVKVGVPEDVANTFKEHSYFDWIAKNSTTQMSRTDYFTGGFSTPSVFIGSKLENGVASDFTKVQFADSDVLKTFNDTLSNFPKGK